MAKNIVRVLQNKLPKVKVAFSQLARQEVLVGVPREDDARKDPGEKEEMNNATLAYIHDNGAPASHIPARPFMRPGVEAVKGQIVDRMKAAAQRAVDTKNQDPKVTQTLNAVGMVTSMSIKRTIGDGIPPPLSPSTVAQRLRSRGTKSRRKGELEYMRLVAEGMDPAAAQESAGIVPLVNTGQMRNAITYVIRDKRGSK